MIKHILLLLAIALPTAARAADPVEFGVGAFPFERPSGWQWVVPSSPMRKAQLAVPGQDGPAEVTFFHFGAGQGGGVEAGVHAAAFFSVRRNLIKASFGVAQAPFGDGVQGVVRSG